MNFWERVKPDQQVKIVRVSLVKSRIQLAGRVRGYF